MIYRKWRLKRLPICLILICLLCSMRALCLIWLWNPISGPNLIFNLLSITNIRPLNLSRCITYVRFLNWPLRIKCKRTSVLISKWTLFTSYIWFLTICNIRIWLLCILNSRLLCVNWYSICKRTLYLICARLSCICNICKWVLVNICLLYTSDAADE